MGMENISINVFSLGHMAVIASLLISAVSYCLHTYVRPVNLNRQLRLSTAREEFTDSLSSSTNSCRPYQEIATNFVSRCPQIYSSWVPENAADVHQAPFSKVEIEPNRSLHLTRQESLPTLA